MIWFLQCMHVKHACHACKKSNKSNKVNSPPLSWELKFYPDIILRQKRSRKVREWTDENIKVQLTKLPDNHDRKRCDFPNRKDLTDKHITWLFKDISLSSVQPPLLRIICENPLPLTSNISYWGGKTMETVFPKGAISGFKQTLHCTWVVHFNYSLRLQLRQKVMVGGLTGCFSTWAEYIYSVEVKK